MGITFDHDYFTGSGSNHESHGQPIELENDNGFNNTIANMQGDDSGLITEGNSSSPCSTGWVVENNLWWNSIQAELSNPDGRVSYLNSAISLSAPYAADSDGNTRGAGVIGTLAHINI